MLIMRDLRVYSRALGITGACDVVEFHKSNDGVPLHGRDELWLPYPIEYKHGKSKTIDADRLQLCAEAMCLEEMLACDIQYAKIFSRVLRGYEGAEDLKKHNDPMVVVILDAATTGRLGVTFYCELQKDEYIKRILQWHVDAAWPLTSFKKSIVEGAERVNVVQYEGAPSFTDIINCACDTSDRSSKSYKRFAKDVKERLIECMFYFSWTFFQ